MPETNTDLLPVVRRPLWKGWLIGGAVVALLAGGGVAIAVTTIRGSPASGPTTATVAAWLQAHPDVAAWMRNHPNEWGWMSQHWAEMQWMQGHWDAMAWIHQHPGSVGAGGMMGFSMPMGGSITEMRQWMSGNGGAWAWMQSHWDAMSWWMSSHWSDMQWMYDHWNALG